MISIGKKKNILIFTGGENLESLLSSILFYTVFVKNSATSIDFSTKSLDNFNFDFIICADSGLEKCFRYGMTPNLILGDMDSLSDKKSLENIDLSILKKYPCDKDFTDTELALNYAFDNFTDSFVTLIGGDGGRMDHLLAILQIYKTNKCPDFWCCNEGAWIYLSDDKFSELTISQLQKKDSISIFPLSPLDNDNKDMKNYKITSIGLKWTLDFVKWEKNEYSVSNCIKDDEDKIRLKCENGRFIVFLPYSCKVEGLC